MPVTLGRNSLGGDAIIEPDRVAVDLRCPETVIDSLSMCKFAGFAIGDEFFARLLSAATGVHYEVQEMLTAGERIWNLERLYNLREGFTRADDTLPPRLLNEPATGASAGQVNHLEPMLNEYYRARGWDTQGVPRPAKLQELGLADLVLEMEK